MTRAYQNFIFQHEPHQLWQRLALLSREDVGTIYPLPVLNRTAVGATFVRALLHSFALLASRISDYHGRSISIVNMLVLSEIELHHLLLVITLPLILRGLFSVAPLLSSLAVLLLPLLEVTNV